MKTRKLPAEILPPKFPSDAVLSVRSACYKTGLGKEAIQNACASGKVPGAFKTANKSNGHWRIPVSGMLAAGWMRAEEVGPPLLAPPKV